MSALLARNALAKALYGDGSAPEWLTTVDGSPNAASFELADRLLIALTAALTEPRKAMGGGDVA